MGLANYTELKAAIASLMNRSDLTASIVDFVTLAESDINSISRLLPQETTANITMVIAQLYNNLPTGFLDVVDFYYKYSVDGFDEQLVKMDVDKLNEIISTDTTNKTMPRAFAISDTILYDVAPDQAYVPVMRYLKAWNIASDATNWLLTNHPGAYLYGALVHAAPFLGGDERIPVWKSMYQEKLDLINDLSSRVRGKTKLGFDAALIGNRHSNIRTG